MQFQALPYFGLKRPELSGCGILTVMDCLCSSFDAKLKNERKRGLRLQP